MSRALSFAGYVTALLCLFLGFYYGAFEHEYAHGAYNLLVALILITCAPSLNKDTE